MEKHKKKVILFIGIILVFIAFIAIVLSLFLKNQDSEEPTNPNTSEEEKFNISIVPLNDYNEFFTVNQIINQYYLSLTGSNKQTIYNLLDEDFKNQEGITLNNLDSKINRNYQSTSYTSLEIYYNPDSVITYYFVNGFLENENLSDDSFQYTKNVKYLVIVNKKTYAYSITPINTDESILNYANRYHLVRKNLELNHYSVVNTSEENVLKTYLNTFKNLLFLDNEVAYNMLSKDTSAKYSSKNDFKNQMLDIYDFIDASIFSYSKKENNNQKLYYIIDDNSNKITIYENKVMDFKISY